ncbi:MAG: phosphoenolpyruvate carboxykinase [Armatimonadetes bacterium]|nr:phosphoenolpyruvate carboxykinase [Armatimonadota bacterium]
MPWRLPGEVTDRSVMLYMTGAVCTQPAQVLQTDLAVQVVQNFINRLRERESRHLAVFADLETEGDRDNPSPAAETLARLLALLCDMSWKDACLRAPDCAGLIEDPLALAELVEELYNHWRHYERYMIFEGSADDSRDSAIEGHMPFIYNNQDLNHLIRQAYRNIERNLRGAWPRVYRQTSAGANMSLLVEQIDWASPGPLYDHLKEIRMVRLALMVPPVILYPRRNYRRGAFVRVDTNPLERWQVPSFKWYCVPIRVGELNFHVYFEQEFLAMGVSLTNLFELAGHDEARQKPDGIVVFGVPPEATGGEPTVFYIDEEADVVVGAVVGSEEVDYFGYFKKMVLTLHNVIVMRRGRLPVHGAMASLRLRGGRRLNLVLVGDSGAGKSETLEAFRVLADEWVSDMTIVFDDMGSLALDEEGRLVGYGTEIGAFVRLDDIGPDYAFGNFDRGIFMNPHQRNARLVLPITVYRYVIAGHRVDALMYANNYEPVEESVPVIEDFASPQDALKVFRAGLRAAKGTTDERGLVHSYFANPFGPEQLRDLHEELAERYFTAAFATGVEVGQVRTQLGVPGRETTGPRQAAEALFARWVKGEGQAKA